MFQNPVSPPAATSSSGGGGFELGPAVVADEDEEVDMKRACLSEPIVGHHPVALDENGPGALEPRPLPSPRSMTPAQRALHNLTHLPFGSGCPLCVSTRSANLPHLSAHEHLRVIPLLVADYCFMRISGDKDLQTVLVMRLYPYKLFFASAVPQ